MTYRDNLVRELGFSSFGEYWQDFLKFRDEERKRHANSCTKILDSLVIEDIPIPEEIKKRDVKKEDKLQKYIEIKRKLESTKSEAEREEYQRQLDEINTRYDPTDNSNILSLEEIRGLVVRLDRIDYDNHDDKHNYLLFIFKKDNGKDLWSEFMQFQKFDEAARTYLSVINHLKNNQHKNVNSPFN